MTNKDLNLALDQNLIQLSSKQKDVDEQQPHDLETANLEPITGFTQDDQNPPNKHHAEPRSSLDAIQQSPLLWLSIALLLLLLLLAGLWLTNQSNQSATDSFNSVSSTNQSIEANQAQLEKLDIKVELRKAPDFGTWVKRISSWDYEATMNGSFNYPDPTIGVHRHFDCDNIKNVIWSNTQGYCDPALDEMLDTAAVESDFDKRAAIYADIQKKAQEDLVFIYMPQDFSVTVYNDAVKGLPDSPFGALAPFVDVYLDN